MISLLTVILLLPVIAYGLLHSNTVQNYLAGYLTAYISNELNTEVRVGGLDIRLFRSIVLEDVYMADQDGEPMLEVSKMTASIQSLSLKNRDLNLSDLHFDDATLLFYKNDDAPDYNFRFFLDYFEDVDLHDEVRERWDVTCSSFRLSNAAFHHTIDEDKGYVDGFDYTDFSIHDLHMVLNDIHLNRNRLGFELADLNYLESEGFQVDHVSGSFTLGLEEATVDNFVFRSKGSDLNFDLMAEYGPFQTVEDFLVEAEFQVYMSPSQVDLGDVAHFVEPLYGLRDSISLGGDFYIGDGGLSGEAVSLTFGEATSFMGDIHIADLLDLPGSDIHMEIEDLHTILSDLYGFSLPEGLKHDTLPVPDYVANAGDLRFSGNMNLSGGNIQTKGRLRTDIGDLVADVFFEKSDNGAYFQYQGGLSAHDFHVGRLFDKPDQAGEISMDIAVNGEGFTLDELDMHVDGHIHSLNLLDYEYQDVAIAGDFVNQKFQGDFTVNDPSVALEFNGMVDLEGAVPEFDFEMGLDNANLTRLNVFQRDSLYDSVVSARLKMNARASSLDDLEGEIAITDVVYEETASLWQGRNGMPASYATDSILIRNRVWSEENQHFRVRSDFLDADMYGHFHFERFGSSLKRLLYEYIPAMRPAEEKMLTARDMPEQDLSFFVRLKETAPLSDLFFPSFCINDGAWINGSLNTHNQYLELEGHADSLVFNDNHFADFYFSGNSEGNSLFFSANSERYILSERIRMEQMEIESSVSDNLMAFLVKWGREDDKMNNSGNLKGTTTVLGPDHAEINFDPSHAYIDGERWQLNVDNRIIIDDARLEMHQLKAYQNSQFVLVDGVLSENPKDRMIVSFAGFDVGYTDYLLGDKKFDFGGKMDGYVSFTGLYQSPAFDADLYVNDFVFNSKAVGELEATGTWSEEQEGFRVEAEVTDPDNPDSDTTPLVTHGYFYPGKEDQNFDLDIIIDEMEMAGWGRYLENFARDFNGRATGELRLEGSWKRPELIGSARFVEASLYVPYLNNSYSFTDDVFLGEDYFRFDDVVLTDPLGNTALLNGDIYHEGFSDFALDIRVRPDEMLIFNTGVSDNTMYYGEAFATGLAHFQGPTDDITLDINARTNRGTRVMIPLDYSGEVGENRFITFVSGEEEKGGEQPLTPPEMSGDVRVNVDLEVTNDAFVELLFDARFGDIISGRGEGDLRLEVAADGSFDIYGDYVIEEGQYLFRLQNIINKQFRIESGSTIRWTGDINEAEVDLRAVYRLRTPLYDLFLSDEMQMESAEMYRQRMPVETVLMLEDQLLNPSISFDIDVSNGNENTRELIQRAITTDQEMNRQVFSLLVLNRFMPPTFDQYDTALGYGVGTTSSELLSNQLSNWLSQISSEFDIGVNYRPGDEVSSQELELALSTQLFDDRVIIDGNFGVAGNRTATGRAAQRTNQIIGDVNVEVMITPEGSLRVKAFNRSNTLDLINTNAPYTQGIGLFYRREFDNLIDLFSRKREPEGIPGFIPPSAEEKGAF